MAIMTIVNINLLREGVEKKSMVNELAQSVYTVMRKLIKHFANQKS